MLQLLGAPTAALEPPIGEHDFADGGEETLWRLLYAVRRFSLADLDRWKKSNVPMADVLATPERYQAEIVTWSGRALRVTKQSLPADAAEAFNLEHYYRCEMAIGPQRMPAIVYSLSVPRVWKLDQPLDESAAVIGFFVRVADGGADLDTSADVRPVLVARRIAWFPANVLGDLQMDAGLFDELSGRPEWAAEDRECFYQLLAAAGRTGPRQLLRQAPKQSPVEPLFNDPKNQRGKLVALTGTARQALLVRVDDADIQARFGIDHYYEVEIFTEDSQGNPLTFCVRELPKGFPEGGKIQEPVRIAGIFLKKWSYRLQSAGGAAEADEQAARRRQLAPLIIGSGPIWLKPPPIDYRLSTTIFVVLFVVMTLVLCLVVWWLNRSGERFHKQVVRRLITTPDRSLDGLDLEDHGKPDFSNLG